MNIKELAKEAQLKGICSPGLKRILASNDKESLIEYMVEGLDFCLDNDFPSVGYLEANGRGIMEKYGIHVNETCSLVNRSRSVLLGGTAADIHLDQYAVSDIFVKHDSKATVYCSDSSFTRIDCFDKSEVNINASGDANVVVSVYGNAKVSYKKDGKAIIKVVAKERAKY